MLSFKQMSPRQHSTEGDTVCFTQIYTIIRSNIKQMVRRLIIEKEIENNNRKLKCFHRVNYASGTVYAITQHVYNTTRNNSTPQMNIKFYILINLI